MRISASIGIAAAVAAAPLFSSSAARGDVTFLNYWGTAGTGPGQFSYPFGVATAPNGNVYVTDEQNPYINVFSASGLYLARFRTAPPQPATGNLAGIAISPLGTGYVADHAPSASKVLTFSISSQARRRCPQCAQ
jgi:DNA-binding beta-propeller fold protein YncE